MASSPSGAMAASLSPRPSTGSLPVDEVPLFSASSSEQNGVSKGKDDSSLQITSSAQPKHSYGKLLSTGPLIQTSLNFPILRDWKFLKSSPDVPARILEVPYEILFPFLLPEQDVIICNK